MQPDKSKLTETLSSGPMLRELFRWTASAPVIVIPRSADWARSMTERYRLVNSPGRASGLTFLQSAILVRLHERLSNFSLNIFSRINLAIQPVLRELHSGEAKASRAGIAQLDGSGGRSPGGLNSIHFRRAGPGKDAGGDLEPLILNESGPSLERRTNPGAMLSAGDDSAANVEGPARGLPLVFQRLRQVDESTAEHRITHAGDVADRVLNLVNRSQRVERSILSSVPEVARPPVPTTIQQPAAQFANSEHAAVQPIETFRAQPSPWTTNAPPVPEAIVEQLTERVIRQIDQRTIAWRERMGKS